jgi:hypothetical protein
VSYRKFGTDCPHRIHGDLSSFPIRTERQQKRIDVCLLIMLTYDFLAISSSPILTSEVKKDI